MKRYGVAALACHTLLSIAPAAGAADKLPQDELRAPAALAFTTSANIAAVAAMLSKNQQDVDALIAARTNAIVERERRAMQAHDKVALELETYDMTRGAPLADTLRALMRRGDRAGAQAWRTAGMETGLRAALAAETSLPADSNALLTAAAKKLATLAEQLSPIDRAKQAREFFIATKDAVQKLHVEADAAKASANANIASEVTTLAN